MNLIRTPILVPGSSTSTKGLGLGARLPRYAACFALAIAALGLPGIAALAKLAPTEVTVETPVYSIHSGPLRPAETWVFDISWTGVPVGQATIAVAPQVQGTEGAQAQVASTPVADEAMRAIKVDIKAETNSFIDFFWRYRLHARARFQTNPFSPGDFYSEEMERTKQKRTTIEFDQSRNVTSSRQKGEKLTQYAFSAPNTYDMIATMFATLSFEYATGAHYTFDTFTGTSRYLIDVDVRERGPFETAREVFDAWRLEVRTKALTDPDEAGKHQATSLWVTSEQPRRLLGAKSDVFIGAVNVNLASVSAGATAFTEQPEFRPTPIEAPEAPSKPTFGAGRILGTTNR